MTGPLRQSSFLISIIQTTRASLARVDEVLYAPVDRPDRATDAPPVTAAPALRAKGLTVHFDGAPQPALNKVDFDLPAGATLGVFGQTGSGKTTLLRVLARLQPPSAGAVEVDGINLQRVDLDGWRRSTSFVTQRPFLFSETLRENLAPDADDGTIEAALLAGVLGPDLERMPDGLQTLVGEAGVRLSGGQRQRIALARALTRPHHLLLLDDTLSAVDHHTEAQLLSHLREAGARCTTVIVAHRVSTLLHCDHVLVLEDGRVIDQGTPTELLARPGPFSDVWAQQQGTAGATP
jgi:ABC-type multidrug transport system fused ATPase/permease subunit